MTTKQSAKGLNTAFVVYLNETHIAEDKTDPHHHICTLRFGGDDVTCMVQFCGEEHPEFDEIDWNAPYILELHKLYEQSKQKKDEM